LTINRLQYEVSAARNGGRLVLGDKRGIGHVVALQVLAERLYEVNRIVEETAGGGDRTEFYPTYD
jgi:hypothetical protein